MSITNTAPTALSFVPNRKRVSPSRIFLNFLVALLLIVEVYPLFWMATSALKAPDEFSGKPMWALPSVPQFGNFARAWTQGMMSTYIVNSLAVVIPSLLITLALGATAAFGLYVLRWKGREFVSFLFVIAILVPLQLVLIPLFVMFGHFNIMDNLGSLGLLYVGVALPFTIFVIGSYLRAIPMELIESATVDGAGMIRTFISIVLPMARNAIMTVGLVQFFFMWNDLLLAMTFISTNEKRTIQAGLLNFVGSRGEVDYGGTFAAIVISVVPTLILYLFLNKQIMKGLTAGSLKG